MNKILKIVLIVSASLAGVALMFYGLIWLFFSNAMIGMGLADTVITLNEEKDIEIGRSWDIATGLPDFQLTIINYNIEDHIILYRVVDSYVYTLNKDNRYTVYDFEHCITICQTTDLKQMDEVHQNIFEDKSRFNDIMYPYIKENGPSKQYPAISLGDGMLYLEYNSLLDEYYLRSKISDGEPIDFEVTARMTSGLPVERVRSIKIQDPYVCVIDFNKKKTIIDYKTYACVYTEYLDKTVPDGISLSPFDHMDQFQNIEEFFRQHADQ
jgi:hypothetical protein